MKANLQILTLFLVVILHLPPIHSQPYIFREISGTEGLSDLMVSALYKDTSGYLWIGTATSVERFDGNRLKFYPVAGDGTDKMKWINFITETIDHKILAGSDNGLWEVSGNSLRAVMPEIIKGKAIRALVTDSLGNLYIGSEKGLVVHKDGMTETVLMDKNHFSAANDITGLNMGDDGRIWLATQNGLYAMHTASKRITHYPNTLLKQVSGVIYRTMTRIGSTLYLGTMTEGIWAFDIPTGQFSRYVDVGCKVIMSLSTDGKDLLYVGTDGNGISFISVKSGEVVRHIGCETGKEGSLRSNSVYSLLVDRDGLVWAGLYQFGVDYTVFQDDLFSVYHTPYFTSENVPVRAIYIDGKRKYIGSRNGLYYVDEKNEKVKQLNFPILRSNIITCIHASEEKVYIGTYGGGMYVFNPQTMELRDFAPAQETPFVKGSVFCIQTDPWGVLWIGTSDGVFRYKNGKLLNHFTTENSPLPGRNVYVVFFDTTHKGWVATDKGLCLWESSSERLRTDLFPKGFFRHEKISAIYEDSENSLYFLPHKGKIQCSDLSMDNFYTFPYEDRLTDKNVVFLTEDKDKWLWIGTNNGLYHYDKKNTFTSYGIADGLPSSIFINCIPQYDEKGTLWLGNTKGLIYLEEDWKRNRPQSKYSIGITEVRINGSEQIELASEKRAGEYKVNLKAFQNNVTVCFSNFAYTNPLYSSYEYKMEGKDEKWQLLAGKSEVTYYNLPAGKHRFKVRYVNNIGSETGLHIHIAPDVNAANIMILLSLSVILTGGLWFALRIRKRRGKRFMDNPPFDVAGTSSRHEQEEEDNVSVKEKYKNYSLSNEECHRLVGKLEKIMREKKPYTDPHLKISGLAKVADISSHTLSYLFNQYLKRNYYDYINDYRIAEFKELVHKGEHVHYTVEALMKRCGFSSSTTFFRYFKKQNGITPSEYIKKQKNTAD